MTSVVMSAVWVSAAPQGMPLVDALVADVGDRVAEYCRRAQHVVCVERSTVQPVQSNMSPDGLARTVESELRLEPADPDGDPLVDVRIIRDIRRINGRAPRERDTKDRSGCTDPTPLSPEPLGFLLPAHRAEYQFTAVRNGKEKERAALIIDFMSVARKSRPELIEDEGGHDDCFDWSGPIANSGRVWIDAGTHDVLRVERRIDGPTEVRVPWTLQRRFNFDAWVVIDRNDETMSFKPVTFRDPDEVIILPVSTESLTLMRGGLQSTRRSGTYSDYHRFLTASRVK